MCNFYYVYIKVNWSYDIEYTDGKWISVVCQAKYNEIYFIFVLTRLRNYRWIHPFIVVTTSQHRAYSTSCLCSYSKSCPCSYSMSSLCSYSTSCLCSPLSCLFYIVFMLPIFLILHRVYVLILHRVCVLILRRAYVLILRCAYVPHYHAYSTSCVCSYSTSCLCPHWWRDLGTCTISCCSDKPRKYRTDDKSTHWEFFSKSYQINPKSDCIYYIPIDLESNGRLFGSKSVGKW